MYTFSFEKLEVWQNAKNFTLDIYRITSQFPRSEIYGLTSQIKRSASSIGTNIAEGVSRNTQKDKAHFLTISFSSAMETLNHLIVARDLTFLHDDDYVTTRSQIEKICNQIINLRKYYLSKI